MTRLLSLLAGTATSGQRGCGMNLPPEEIMREMAKIAMEQATAMFARRAREFAATMTPAISSKDALNAFANAIESTNATVWPKGPSA